MNQQSPKLLLTITQSVTCINIVNKELYVIHTNFAWETLPTCGQLHASYCHLWEKLALLADFLKQ